MLALSGEVADGTVLGCMSSPQYIRWARERIAEGQARASGAPGRARHLLPTLAFCSVAEDGDVARDRLRPVLAFYLSLLETGVGRAYSDAVGVTEDVVELARRGGAALVAEQMPDEWLDAFAVVGTPQECVASIRRLLDAGADSVVLMPLPPEHSAEVLELAGAQIIPALAPAPDPA
jgi:alkanesulfonate monooxygenase SsuD/methylene tetrahydromethanopterin reductase-like flavin-dependent oxidoreductase (luciferase family)